ncbi:hypothetical protein WN51_06052 [Melipona quadrifasciata]|uniref:Uncharacterized protein n=1 Tax=Melipona quadrifasciata TaxID=166423 RepID=A0A0N1IT16_9HYME|nr:hypothetical protein WN51_06052 [Melipona quadrifasciata]
MIFCILRPFSGSSRRCTSSGASKDPSVGQSRDFAKTIRPSCLAHENEIDPLGMSTVVKHLFNLQFLFETA